MTPQIRIPRKFHHKRKLIDAREMLLNTTNSLFSDIECIVEMFHTVIPVLSQIDKTRRDKILYTFQSIKDYQKEKREKANYLSKALGEIRVATKEMKKINKARIMFQMNSLVIMVSSYDQFLAGVLRSIFLAYPGRLYSQEKTLSYDEILQLGSLDKAIDKFIDKEIDILLRDSHLEQIKYIEKQLKIDILNRISQLPQFIEMIERRNIFVHNGGIINQQYLSICKSNNIAISGDTKEGKTLNIDEDYLRSAHKCLLEVGLIIGQLVFRKLWPDQLEAAGYELNQVGYDYLLDENWDFANLVFDFALSFPKSQIITDERYKIFIINKCIALKWSGQETEMEKLLSGVDWSSAHPKFVLNVHVLKNEYKEAEGIMSSMNAKGDVSEYDFITWPVFRDFRNTPNFKRAFKRVFHKEYEQKISASDVAALQEQVNDNVDANTSKTNY
jgi:hypothetical protein